MPRSSAARSPRSLGPAPYLCRALTAGGGSGGLRPGAFMCRAAAASGGTAFPVPPAQVGARPVLNATAPGAAACNTCSTPHSTARPACRDQRGGVGHCTRSLALPLTRGDVRLRRLRTPASLRLCPLDRGIISWGMPKQLRREGWVGGRKRCGELRTDGCVASAVKTRPGAATAAGGGVSWPTSS